MGALLPFHLATTSHSKSQNPSLSFPKPPPLPLTRPPLLLFYSLLSKERGHVRCRLHSTSPAASRLPVEQDTSPSVPDADEVGDDGGGERFDWLAQWYPVAPVCDLDKRAPQAKTVMGIDVVVWWDRVEGKWQVFEDSCPHRLAPLSEGRIDQWGRLQCVYHGWCFDGQGSCKYIPQAPDDGPPLHTFKKACASVYPTFEQNKIVWFWPNSDPKCKEIAMRKKPPYIPELDDPSYTCTMGIRDIPYGYEVLTENLMDPAHVPYAHYGIMRNPKRKGSSTRADREGGVPLDFTVQDFDITGFSVNQEKGQSRFVAPCVFYVSNTFDSLEGLKKDQSTKSNDIQRRFLLLFICIPVGPSKSRLIWVFPRNFAVWIDHIVPRWMFHVGQNLILDSDLYLLHLEERKLAEIGAINWQKACFVPTKSDAIVVCFRKWLRKFSGGQVNWGNKFKPDLPPTPPREQLMDRYRSHVLQCTSCHGALKFLKVVEVSLQFISIASIGIVAALKQNALSTMARNVVVSAAVLCFIFSRWLSHFMYKNFYYHDYNHSFK